jgi:two-component system, sensor histidine kinase RegB
MPRSSDRHHINLQWLVRLRWGAVLGQASVILAVDQWVGIPLPVAMLLTIVGIELASNLLVALWARRARAVHEGVIAAVIAFDVLLLTVLLFFSGGAFNPFNFLYLVYMALAAVVLEPRWTWSLLALSALSFGALFTETFGPGDGGHVHHADQMQMHLKGMWVAYAVAAVFIIYFVQRITHALAQQDEELVRARERTAQSEKLASLATLAAGAAHELSTPLSTIALVAGELRGTAHKGRLDDLDDDLLLIQGQVDRCRGILEQMSTDAGDSPGEAPVALSVGALADEVCGAVQRPNPVQIELAEGCAEIQLRVPRRAMVRALRGLVDNACDASSVEQTVVLAIAPRDGGIQVVVSDRGAGMAPEILERAGEPFFTTKDPGAGMGLGIFLARAIAEQLGGSLELTSNPGRGTRAAVVLPPATIDHLADRDAAAEE